MMHAARIAYVCAAAAVLSALTVESAGPRWSQLTSAYNYTTYCTDHEKGDALTRQFELDIKTPSMTRGELFVERLESILAHNADPTKTWKQGVNQFTDLFESEIQRLKGLDRKALFHKAGMAATTPLLGEEASAALLKGLPHSVDWREKGVVTPVKNQGGCGSCWAFAGTETVESHLAIATGKLLELAPQEFVDCAKNPNHCGGTGGCEGATAEIVFSTVMAKGVVTETTYPYKGTDGTCHIGTPVANITGQVMLPRNEYAPLMNAIANIGPIAISVDASWGAYESGVFPASSGGTNIDHAVQLVGYGTDKASGMDYWLVRNSWGASWGEEGYIRLERTADGKPCATDTNNQDGTGCENDPKSVTVCGTSAILYDTSYPTGAYML